MKKLSIEEKAKAYDEALKAAIVAHKDEDRHLKATLERIFPGLKESNDERIRKALIDYFRWNPNGQLLNEFSNKEVFAWFEKQGGQKLTDKVEPKFREGDWVVLSTLDGEKVVHVDFIEYFKSGEPIYVTSEDRWFDNRTKAHLWTIQDTKDGDVLVWDDSKCIAIFKNIYDEDSFNSYGFVGGCTGSFESRQSYHDIEGAHPATKEQRDTLMKAMADAGYTFDFEKKELKKIKQEPAWSEEDEYYYNIILYILNNEIVGKADKENAIDWFESLRPQNNITDEELAQAKKDAYNDALNKIEYHSGEPTFDDGWSAAIWYLKKRNAQPQNHWKPSDEQMDELRKYSDNVVLRNLYYNLKKIKG